jgi:hypothetical protein
MDLLKFHGMLQAANVKRLEVMLRLTVGQSDDQRKRELGMSTVVRIVVAKIVVIQTIVIQVTVTQIIVTEIITQYLIIIMDIQDIGVMTGVILIGAVMATGDILIGALALAIVETEVALALVGRKEDVLLAIH